MQEAVVRDSLRVNEVGVYNIALVSAKGEER